MLRNPVAVFYCGHPSLRHPNEACDCFLGHFARGEESQGGLNPGLGDRHAPSVKGLLTRCHPPAIVGAVALRIINSVYVKMIGIPSCLSPGHKRIKPVSVVPFGAHPYSGVEVFDSVAAVRVGGAPVSHALPSPVHPTVPHAMPGLPARVVPIRARRAPGTDLVWTVSDHPSSHAALAASRKKLVRIEADLPKIYRLHN